MSLRQTCSALNRTVMPQLLPIQSSLCIRRLARIALHARLQVEKTQDLVEQTKRKASAVTAQASAVSSGAKSITKAAERQLDALSKAIDMVPSVTAATEEALAALRCVNLALVPSRGLGRELPRLRVLS